MSAGAVFMFIVASICFLCMLVFTWATKEDWDRHYAELQSEINWRRGHLRGSEE